MPRVIADGRQLFHGALDTFDYSHDRRACACVCVRVCAAHFIANAIRGERNKQPRRCSRSKCPKGEECDHPINITCKTHKVSRILHQAQKDISKASSERLFVWRQMFSCKNVKKHHGPSPAPRAIASYLDCHVRWWLIIEVCVTSRPGHSGERFWIFVPHYKHKKLNCEYMITLMQNMIS